MPACEPLFLHPDRPLCLDAARQAELRVEQGVVWITAEGRTEDLFLGPGECYRVPRAGKVLAEALRGRAVVRLERSGRRVVPNRLSAFGA